MDPFPPIVSVTLRKCPSDRSMSTVGSKPILCPAHVPDLIEVRNASFKEFLFFFWGQALVRNHGNIISQGIAMVP